MSLRQKIERALDERLIEETCSVHSDTPLVRFCPKCRASKGGSSTSERKRAAAVLNGAKGGNPGKRRKRKGRGR